jgi:IS66 C-terminal element
MSTASQEGPGLAKVYPGLRLFGMLNSLSDPLAKPGASLNSDSNSAPRTARRASSRKTLRAVPSLGPEPPPAPLRRASQTPSTLGARHVGIIQTLLVTCRLHDIDPYPYLVDVLQRVGQHPAARVAELTPRLWKQHFADNPLRSDLYGLPE